MKLYSFDEITDQLELVPLAARRALDHAGLKLSRAAWAGLPLSARQAVVRAGAASEVPCDDVRALIAGAAPVPEAIAPSGDPPADHVPEAIAAAYARPIAPALWAALSPLDRYALAKVARSQRPERVAAAYDEIVTARAGGVEGAGGS